MLFILPCRPLPKPTSLCVDHRPVAPAPATPLAVRAHVVPKRLRRIQHCLSLRLSLPLAYHFSTGGAGNALARARRCADPGRSVAADPPENPPLRSVYHALAAAYPADLGDTGRPSPGGLIFQLRKASTERLFHHDPTIIVRRSRMYRKTCKI